MTFRIFSRIAAAISLIFSPALLSPVAHAAPVAEVVSPFSLAAYTPVEGLVKGPDGNYWGTTISGGPANDGTIYRMKPDGTWEVVIFFDDAGTQHRGRTPCGRLTFDGQGNLWGATSIGGENNRGTVFKYNITSGAFTTVHHFRIVIPNRIVDPQTGLTPDGKGFMWGTTPSAIYKINIASGAMTPVLSFSGTIGPNKGLGVYAELTHDGGDYLWGCTQSGGTADRGTIFKVNVNTGALTTVVELTGNSGAAKGSYPSAPLYQDASGYLWGTTVYGGTQGLGTVYKIHATSGQFTTVAEFTGDSGAMRGENPVSTLTPADDGTLWGVTSRGGFLFSIGTIFKVNPATGITTMVLDFPDSQAPLLGRYPKGDLTNMGDGFMMGIASQGGGLPPNTGGGTIYKVNTSTAAATNLAWFTDAGTSNIGREPWAGLVTGSDGLLWGGTSGGGRSGCGCIFKCDPLTGLRTTVVEFTGVEGNAIGSRPIADLVPDGRGTIWGTTQGGGINDRGTLFKINEQTGALTTVFQFGQWSTGKYPTGLTLDSAGFLWGTLGWDGGNSDYGGIYRVHPPSGTVTLMVSFTRNGTENKGSNPFAALYDDGAGFLWGSTSSGGTNDLGTLFKFEKSTWRLTTLVSFTGAGGAFRGACPSGKLVDDGAGFLWGTTYGGTTGLTGSLGSIFKIAKATGAFTHVLDFTGNGVTNKGSSPFGGLAPDGQGSLWGLTNKGGPNDSGTIFKVGIATGILSTQVILDRAHGIEPRFVTLCKYPADGHFYGTTQYAGPQGAGTIFRVRLGPTPVTQAATLVTSTTATIHGTITPNGSPTTVSFEYGTAPDLTGATTVQVASGANGSTPLAYSRALTGLLPKTTYYYRITGTNAENPVAQKGRTLSFRTKSDDATLANLLFSPRQPSPPFQPSIHDYWVTMPGTPSAASVTAVPTDSAASIRVNGTPATAGSPFMLDLPTGTSGVTISVTAEDGVTVIDYAVAVTRLPASFELGLDNIAPLSLSGLNAADNVIELKLTHQPLTGRTLNVIGNTGLDFIQGNFTNLAHGQVINLLYEGRSYPFVANYYGGDGNDLVLQWADTALHGWGANASSQLGTGDGTKGPVLTVSPVERSPRAGTNFGLAAGYMHSLALAADGKVSAWGSNTFGQLGDGSKTSSDRPVIVPAAGALSRKTVVAVAAGAFHSLALCSDGTVAAWGYNNHGQLGNGNTTTATQPVAVDASGALANKQVVAIAAGAYHSIARCSDGSVVAWGFNGTGALGNNSTTGSSVPVLVTFPSVSTPVTAIAAGQYHSVALLEDGSVYSWGFNDHGQLGHGTRANALQPLPVTLSQKASRIAAGGSHSLAQLQDGKLFAWGNGASGQLGDGARLDRLAPVPVLGYGTGPIEGEAVESLAAGMSHSVAFFSSGRAATWGDNAFGQLGNGTTNGSDLPVSVTPSPDGRLISAVTSSSASHVLASLGWDRSGSGATQEAAAPALLAWRQLHFGSTANSGDSADEADFDGDGIANLVEYAFGTDPKSLASATIPRARTEGGYLVIEFTASAEELGVTFGASSTRNPLTDTWQALPDEGHGDHHLFRLPLDGGQGFMRLHVNAR